MSLKFEERIDLTKAKYILNLPNDKIDIKTLINDIQFNKIKEVCQNIEDPSLSIKLIKEQLPDLEDHQILEEPVRRNTAPCVAYAAHKIHALNENANIIYQIQESEKIIKFKNRLRV